MANEEGPYKPDWQSISAQYQIPTWYQDAKFGIFIHWGVYSVPAYHDEWYPRWMYMNGPKTHDIVFDHHVATFGPQDKFGYKDFIPLFKAEKFDPDAWAKLFKESGARYVVPVAEHHDGFSMYDSAINPWNSVKMGPHRDIIGELSKAIRAQGLKFGLSSHRAEHWFFFEGGRNFPSDVQDPKYAGLYGPARDRKILMQGTDPGVKPFLADWLARSEELVDKYQPDLVYFDVVGSWSPAIQPYLQEFAAHYYNQGVARNHDSGSGVVIDYKSGVMPKEAGVLDLERSVADTKLDRYWQTDTSVGEKSWSYTTDDTFKSPKQLINEFIDVVSKNGGYLLNIGPKSDGTIPAPVQDILHAFGSWLGTNGVAIYGSRPAAIYGEGPTHPLKTGPGRDRVENLYTAQDFRFTTHNGVLYAIALDWPKDGSWTIHSLATGQTTLLPGEVKEVKLLGDSEPLNWKRTADGLVIQAPAKQVGDYAYAFQIDSK